jgi:hypothetical protein
MASWVSGFGTPRRPIRPFPGASQSRHETGEAMRFPWSERYGHRVPKPGVGGSIPPGGAKRMTCGDTHRRRRKKSPVGSAFRRECPGTGRR